MRGTGAAGDRGTGAHIVEVGIRELKATASQIFDEVEERGARYVITRRGRPVAVLLPLEEALPRAAGPHRADAWRELERLGEEIERRRREVDWLTRQLEPA